MRTIKQILLSLLYFVVFFATISAMVIIPYYNNESMGYQDASYRKSLAGKIDYIILGASQGQAGFIPKTLDEELGCYSYNLSIVLMPMHARRMELEQELARNDVKTVVVEVSYDFLQLEAGHDAAVADERVLTRIDNWSGRFEYLTKHIRFDDWLNVYAHSFVTGIINMKTMYYNRGLNNEMNDSKGHLYRYKADITLTAEEAAAIHETKPYERDFYKDNYEVLKEILDICNEHGITTYIVCVPVSDAYVWEYSNLDDFLQWGQELAAEKNCLFLDFNLLKTRYEDFTDKESFSDKDHMSEEGAIVFTQRYIEVVKKIEAGEYVSGMFYSSYKDMIADSPYAK